MVPEVPEDEPLAELVRRMAEGPPADALRERLVGADADERRRVLQLLKASVDELVHTRPGRAREIAEVAVALFRESTSEQALARRTRAVASPTKASKRLKQDIEKKTNTGGYKTEEEFTAERNRVLTEYGMK